MIISNESINEKLPNVFPGETFNKLYEIITRLRGPGGCPWDREQNPSSLRGDLIEETYECIEAIDEKNPDHIREELGDLFLLTLFLAYIHEEEGIFSAADALNTACEKLVRRHPHVFGEMKFNNSAEVIENWNKIKVEQEGRKPKDSILDGVSKGLPPLDHAFKIQKKAAKVGFDWPDIEGVTDKIKEELNEVMEAAKSGSGNINEIEGELGDLLFSVVNLSRYLNVEPSLALRRTNSKFIERFKYMEKKMKETDQEMRQENLDLMDRYWNEAKG